MNFDLRIPVGLMFSIFGILLSGFGLFGGVDNSKSLGINMNLNWGIFMLIFGGLMLAFVLRGAKQTRSAETVREE